MAEHYGMRGAKKHRRALRYIINESIFHATSASLGRTVLRQRCGMAFQRGDEGREPMATQRCRKCGHELVWIRHYGSPAPDMECPECGAAPRFWRSPLRFCLGAVSALLAKGADINAKGNGGGTAGTASVGQSGVSIRSLTHPAHTLALEAENFYDASSDEHHVKYRKLVELIDRALAVSPQDADLLYAKASALDELPHESGHVEQFGDRHPGYFDIVMRGFRPNFRRPLPENWEGLFDLGQVGRREAQNSRVLCHLVWARAGPFRSSASASPRLSQ